MMLSKIRRWLSAMFFGGGALCLAANIAGAQLPSEKAPMATPQTAPNPELKQRPAMTQEEKVAEARIWLDVVVTDKSGAPVAGLDAKDFSLQNNGKPQAIVTFRA